VFLATFFEKDLKFLLPEFFLVTSVLIIILYGSIYSVSKKQNFPLINISTCCASLLTLASTAVLVFSTKDVSSILFNGTFVCDVLTQNTKLLVLGGIITSLIINLAYVRDYKINSFEYFLLTLVAGFGLMLLCSSFDLISVYLAVELQSLCLYVLAAFNRESTYSTEAGLKYFILGAFSSGLLLFGISVLYGFTGTTNFEDFHLLLSLESENQQAIQAGIACLSCALLFKVAAAPFHVWSPDVYDGAPLNSTIFFALVPKIALLLTFLRIFFFCFGSQSFYWQYIIAFCAIASIVVGSFFALKQSKLKRLLAYSSTGHVGYVLIAVSSGALEGIHAALIYLAVYMVISAGIWSVISCLESSFTSGRTRTLADLVTVGKSNPLLAFSIMILFFSMAGIPPLAGFYSKICVFLASINASMYVYSTLIIFVSVVSTYYYIRVVKIVYFEKASKKNFYRPLSKGLSLVLGLFSFCNVFLFINPCFLSLFTYEMVLCLISTRLSKITIHRP
jgi:NADH-quinone oxidoreductase subunit N